MSANYTPEKEDLKILTPFKMQVLTNFPYIEADFDALTNYQLLCKVVEYLNNVITETNEVTEQTVSLYNAYVSLQNYVNQEIGDFETTVNNRVDGLESYMNNYFNNLDVQQEINNKLDAMATDGTLTNLIKNYVDPIYQAYETSINNQIDLINDKVNSATSGSPAGVYATLSALQAADPNHDRIYVVTETGKWYYYNTSLTSWSVGGDYQSTAIGENEISYYNFDSIVNSHLNINKLSPSYTTGYYIQPNGAIIADADYEYSEPILLKENQTLYFYGKGYLTYISMITECDSEGNNRKSVVSSVDSTKQVYYYKAPADTYVTICSETAHLEYPYILDNNITSNDMPTNYDFKISSNDICLIIDDNTSYTDNKYIYYPNGRVADTTGTKASDYVSIVGGSNIKIICDSIINNHDDYTGLAFYDKNKTYISGYKYEMVKTKELSVPANAYYIRVSRNDYLKYFYIYYIKLSDYMKQYAKKDINVELYKAFDTVGIIGDSLASGESAYKQDGTTKFVDLYNLSWGQFMSRDSGNTYYNFSIGGLTTRTWLSNTQHGYPLASDGDHDCKAYIIALGINDVYSYGSEYLGATTDINLSNPSLNNDTFYGNYAKIIQLMKVVQPKAKFFLFTIPETNSSYNDFNDAIRYMATIFNNVYIIDLKADYITEFTSGSFIYSNMRGNHYNAIAYEYMAKLFEKYISDYMYNNYSEFSQVEFIGTNYEWTS